MQLGSVLETTQGFAAPSVGRAHRRAQALCEQLGETAQQTRVLYGLAHFHMVRAELAKACEIGERCVQLANELDEPGYLVDARLVLGGSLGHCGRLDEAREHLEAGLAQYDATHGTAHQYRLAVDTNVFGRSFLGHVLWLLGYPDRAQEQLQKAVSTAKARADPFSMARAWAYTTMLYQFMRDAEETMRSASEVIAVCEEHHFEYYGAWGQYMHAWAVDQLHGGNGATNKLETALDRLARTGAGLRRSYYLGVLAESHLAHGESGEGLRVIDAALRDVATTGERWAEPELYRIQGQLLLQSDPRSQARAEQCLRKAVQCASSQKALSLQLRAAVTLARLLRDRGERMEAERIVSRCYRQFTEGLDKFDLTEAEALMEELA